MRIEALRETEREFEPPFCGLARVEMNEKTLVAHGARSEGCLDAHGPGPAHRAE